MFVYAMTLWGKAAEFRPCLRGHTTRTRSVDQQREAKWRSVAHQSVTPQGGDLQVCEERTTLLNASQRLRQRMLIQVMWYTSHPESSAREMKHVMMANLERDQHDAEREFQITELNQFDFAVLKVHTSRKHLEERCSHCQQRRRAT
eukprot:3901492-Amphidinium_carterae.2